MPRKALIFSMLLLLVCFSLFPSVNATSMWRRTYGTEELDRSSSLIATSDGGYIIAGHRANKIEGTEYRDGYAIEFDFWLIKLDASGNMMWNQTYGGSDSDEASSVVATPDGGYAIVGRTYSFGAGIADFWIVKTDGCGNMQWNQTYGGTAYDGANSVIVTSDGGYALAGNTQSFGGGSNAWLIKTNSNGVMEWSKTYGEAYRDGITGIIAASDGGFALIGNYAVSSTETYLWLIKTDLFGNVEWSRTFDGGVDSEMPAHELIMTTDGGYVFAGNADVGNSSDFWLLRTDSLGNMLWNHTYGGLGDDRALALAATPDGGYAIAGVLDFYTMPNVFTVTYHGKSFLVKTDSVGNRLWNQTFSATEYEEPYSIIALPDGYVLTGVDGRDIWLLKTDELGAVSEYSSWLVPLLTLVSLVPVLYYKKRLPRKCA